MIARVVPDPIVVRRRNELLDLYHDWAGDGDPDDDPEFVDAAREIMGLPPLSDVVRAAVSDDGDFYDEDPGEPDDEQRARAQARMDEIDPDGPDDVARAAGADVTPGHDELHHYWTRDPRGLAKWAKSPHPWTALYHHLVKFVGPERAKRMASQWHKEVFGIWVGEKKGKNPLGPG